MTLQAVPDLPSCDCPRTIWHHCDCPCHVGTPFSLALLNRTFTQIWNEGLPADSPDRRRYLT